jgi:NAD(P)-dependent dehydrogenase (short-subunit alcohol dehydrogenase family)
LIENGPTEWRKLLTERWQERVALVTGGSSGIGRATALTFARRGAKVVVADIQVEEGKATVREIEQGGGEALFVEADVSQSTHIESLFETIVDSYGQLDFACNNSGIEGEAAPTAECTEENWDRVLSINLRGVWLCMKHEIRQMLGQGGGAIVNVSSVLGLVGSENIPAYIASKHGIVGLTKTAALEYATDGIRVNAVCPGLIHTAMIERFTAGDKEIQKELAEGQLLKRMGEPEEVAEAIAWLCSDSASFVTGHAMAVDGGFVAQ